MVVISAMFPMIPQYFFNSNNLNEGQVKIKKKRKIVVTSVIDVDAESSDFSVQEVLEPIQEELEVQVFCQDNTIKCNSLNWFWLQQVHLAEDCHSYNIILYKESISSLLKIKTVRKILPEDKLVLWFSRDLLLTLQIPFLLPNNILSEKQYICHLCRFHCEMPNPIKIHLSLECGKNSKSVLWNRLRHICSEKLIKEENLSPTLSPLLPHTELKESSNHSSSAFKPYKKVEKDNLQDKMCALLPNVILTNNEILPESNLLYKQAVEMETIVSNLGRFKQGHLCIYCGKVYSRKYGLKIHIRTHTGFKPLKCKYCMRPFGDPSNLNKHVRLHSEGETPYKCEQCGKILVRKRDLDRHIKSRHYNSN